MHELAYNTNIMVERIKTNKADSIKTLETLVDWTREVSQPVQGLLVPVSGGTDSALAFWVCTQARPGEVLGVHTDNEPLRGREWFESKGKLEIVETPGLEAEIEEMRWARFLNMNIVKDYGLVGSRTRTEDLMGTYSHASRVATYQPLINTWKSDVIKLCKELGVPTDIIASSYEADCNCGRPERMSCIPFEARDDFLRSEVLGEEGIDLSDMPEEDQKYLKGVVVYNAFKRDLPFRGPAA